MYNVLRMLFSSCATVILGVLETKSQWLRQDPNSSGLIAVCNNTYIYFTYLYLAPPTPFMAQLWMCTTMAIQVTSPLLPQNIQKAVNSVQMKTTPPCTAV